MKILMIFAVSTFIILSCSIHGINNHSALKVNDKLPPRIEIEIPNAINFDQKLDFKWRITNPNDFSAFVYSSLLKQAAFADILVNSEEKTIEVYFTRLERVPIAPYFFPKTEFIEIQSSKSVEGHFIGDNHIGEKAIYTNKDRNAELKQITPGKWQIRIAIAYGYETDNSKNRVNNKSDEIEDHPINSIVRWQQIAYSDFKTILIENKN